MEERLIQIIKEGKGEIKQLLEAERELGVWRTKIEETEGELAASASVDAGRARICARTSAKLMRWKVRHSTHPATTASSTLIATPA